MKRFFKLSFAIWLVLTFARAAYAANFAEITVYPVTRSIVLSEKETRSVAFTVYNRSDETQSVSIRPRYWRMTDKNRDIPIYSWLKIAQDEFEIGPGEKREIAFEVSAPEKASGELAAMIAFKPKPKEGQAVNVVFSVSLYARIKETEKIDYGINAIKLWKFKDRDALGVKVALGNYGNVHLKPRITVYIQNIFNKNLKDTVLRYGKPVYPGDVQGYEGAVYNFKLKPGIYKVMIDTEFSDIASRLRRKAYFLAGRDGNILFMFFKKRRQKQPAGQKEI